MRDEARELLADARRLEQQAVERILDQATVVCATTTGLDADLLGARQFDLAVIDEACQSTEPRLLDPAAARDAAGAGRRSLPAAADGAFGRGGPGRLGDQPDGTAGRARRPAALSRRLTVQYRMHDVDHGLLVAASSTTTSWSPIRVSPRTCCANSPASSATP